MAALELGPLGMYAFSIPGGDTYSENCAHAAGSNNTIGYLVIIIEVEEVKAKALLDSGYIGNYINLK
jgi:hypothetical protein